ncbi:hypothetical protein LCGC14_1105330 [marine sediment metagenome]|uniref:HK97 gp10 family phage protein n=1 Tax=marine sediment metagenome TaxID=412755 RepID=A0A0F9M8A4_9ZZZZ
MQFTLKFIGGKKLFNALKSSKTIAKPLDNGIRRITLQYENLVKKATVVDTGRLRSSIHHELNPKRASVGTNVQYAQFVEYGTSKMEARHMEGSAKVLDEGMFAHAWGKLKDWLSKGKHDIQVDIDKEFKK